jgi:primosomal protein N' (replication factor Y)
MSYPPFGALANLLIRALSEEEARDRSAALARSLEPVEGVRVMGPAAAAMVRLKNEYRYQMLLKAASRKALNETLRRVREFAAAEKWNPVSLVIDVDPVTLL